MKLTGKTVNALADVRAYAPGKKYLGRVTKVTVEDVDVKGIRERLKLSQEGFAERFGFPIATLKNWEQGRRKPEHAAKVLLRLIDRQPNLVEREVKRAKDEMEAT
jgi:putative transcriptional regulator